MLNIRLLKRLPKRIEDTERYGLYVQVPAPIAEWALGEDRSIIVCQRIEDTNDGQASSITVASIEDNRLRNDNLLDADQRAELEAALAWTPQE